jgi:hypothetical protein
VHETKVNKKISERKLEVDGKESPDSDDWKMKSMI